MRSEIRDPVLMERLHGIIYYMSAPFLSSGFGSYSGSYFVLVLALVLVPLHAAAFPNWPTHPIFRLLQVL
jgi:hypothetical protein